MDSLSRASFFCFHLGHFNASKVERTFLSDVILAVPMMTTESCQEKYEPHGVKGIYATGGEGNLFRALLSSSFRIFKEAVSCRKILKETFTFSKS